VTEPDYTTTLAPRWDRTIIKNQLFFWWICPRDHPQPLVQYADKFVEHVESKHRSPDGTQANNPGGNPQPFPVSQQPRGQTTNQHLPANSLELTPEQTLSLSLYGNLLAKAVHAGSQHGLRAACPREDAHQ